MKNTTQLSIAHRQRTTIWSKSTNLTFSSQLTSRRSRTSLPLNQQMHRLWIEAVQTAGYWRGTTQQARNKKDCDSNWCQRLKNLNLKSLWELLKSSTLSKSKESGNRIKRGLNNWENKRNWLRFRSKQRKKLRWEDWLSRKSRISAKRNSGSSLSDSMKAVWVRNHLKTHLSDFHHTISMS